MNARTEEQVDAPAPWRLGGSYVFDANDNFVAMVGCTYRTFASCDAIGRLIAAAPDLLALAKKYASECSECGGTAYISSWEKCMDCADIRAVIAKVEGQS